MLKALIFDCDGVLVDTERDGHRVAFNRTFKERGYDFEWEVKQYGDLLKIAGGKERMRHYFNTHGWPPENQDRDEFIRGLHKRKTEIYMDIVASGELTVRPGILRLIDEAIANGIRLAVCSTSNERAVNHIVNVCIGSERKSKFDIILAGDVVSRKKPDPEIYQLAAKQLGLEPSTCCVIEDSYNGLVAVKSAGMYCVVTWNGYTKDENFSQADLVVDELGDQPDVKVTLDTIGQMMR